jgi:hypothetical protein
LGVSGTSSNDVWIVGDDPSHQSLALHWDGSAWTRVTVPEHSGAVTSELDDVVAISPDDAWAVGNYHDASFDSHRYLLHWDGSSWRQVHGPGGSSPGSYWDALTATSSSDVWATGLTDTGQTSSSTVAHWDGTSWSVSRLPARLAGASPVTVSADSPSDAWLVAVSPRASGKPKETVGRWDGTRWTVQG